MTTGELAPRTLSYGCSLLAVALAIVLRWLCDPVVGERYPYATLFMAVLLSACFFGTHVGLFAVAAGELAANYFLLPPRFSFALQTRDDVVGLVIDTALGLAIALLGGSMHRSRARLLEAAREASRERAHLRLVLDSLTEGVLALDDRGRVVSANAAALRLMGMAEARALGQLSDSLLPTDEARGRTFEVRTERLPESARAQGVAEMRILVDVRDRLELSSTRQTLENVRAQESVRIAVERERQMQMVIAQAPVAVAMLDRQLRYIVTSERWSSSFGLDGQPLQGRAHYEVFPDVSERWKQTFERCLAGASERADEEAVTRPDGSVVWYRWQIQPWSTEPGVVQGIVVYSEDITTRKRAIDALRESEERLRLIIEGATDYAIYMLDAAGLVISWNQGAQRLFGYTAEQILGRHVSLFHTLESVRAAVPEQGLRAALEHGRHTDEGWRVRNDGSRFWAEGVLFCLRDGEVLRGFAKITRDITQRRRTEELQRAVIDNAFDTIVSIDEQGIVESFNGAGEKLFGYAANEVVGRNVKVLMPEPYKTEHDSYVARYKTTGDAQIIGKGGRELSGRRKDGRIFPMELAITEFRVDSERHFTGILRDLTERRRLEDQLRQAVKMEAIGLLAGGVAHDFNNILFVILGYGELLLERMPAQERGHAELLEVVQAAQRASELTKQLLMFSRQHKVESDVVDAPKVVSNLQRMLKRIVGEDVRLVHESLADDLRVKMPASHLEQVVMNLVVNARDAMPGGGVLRLRTEEAHLDARFASEHMGAEAGRYLALHVSDTGTGMSEEVRARVFEPFFTTKDKSRGTGLGLSMVFNIVQQAKGAIQVRSELGQGTTFSVYLPVTLEIPGVASPKLSSMAERAAGTILVVEDEAQVRDIATRILEERGYVVWSAINGVDALDRYAGRANEIDLLLTDVVMPGMSGPELAKELRRIAPTLRVLYMSGYTDDALARTPLDALEAQFVAKPTTPAGLLAKVHEVLAGASAVRESSARAG